MIYLICAIIYIVSCYGYYVSDYKTMSEKHVGSAIYLCVIYPLLLIALGVMASFVVLKEKIGGE